MSLKPRYSHVSNLQHRKQLSNWEHQSPYAIAAKYRFSMLFEKYWSAKDQLGHVDSVTFAELQQTAAVLLRVSRPELLLHGNITEEGAIKMHESLYAKCESTIPDVSLLLPSRVVRFPLGSSLCVPSPIPNNNFANNFTLQISNDPTERVLTDLFVQVFKEALFDLLRTKEQLGYLVRLSSQESRGVKSLIFEIQSEKDPLFLDRRIESFLEDHARPFLMATLTLDEFARHKEAYLAELLAKKKHLSQETNVYWQQIEEQRFDFERIYKDAKLIEAASLLDLQVFADLYIWKDASQRRKLSIHIWTQDNMSFAQKYEERIVADRLQFVNQCALYASVQ